MTPQTDPEIAHSASNDRGLLAGPRPRWAEFLSLLGIVGEFLRGFRRLHFVGPCVTVFGSARFGEGHPYYALGREVGREIAGEFEIQNFGAWSFNSAVGPELYEGSIGRASP